MIIRIISILCFSCFFQVNAQIVETVIISHPKIADGIYVDGTGNVYTTPGGLQGGIQIGKYDINLSSYNPNFALGFAGPINIASFRDSLLIVTNFDNNTVSSLNLNTNISTVIASGLHGPAGIVIDAADNIYISNWGTYQGAEGHRIHKIEPTGSVHVYIDSIALRRPQAMTINHLGELIIFSDLKLYKVNPLDSSLQLWVNLGFGIGNMSFRKKDSIIYGTGGFNHKVMQITAHGVPSVFCGSVAGFQDGPIGTAKFNRPQGIAFSSSEDTLYLTDLGSSRRLRRIIFQQSVGISEAKSLDRNVFPNPIKDKCNIHIGNLNETKIEIFNLKGNLVFSEIRNEKEILIDLSDLRAGSYFLKVINNNSISTEKIIKI